ncbi:Protein of unknown function [Psychrobacillus psychrotolerans]|uniref:DUF2804 domain-containing protein n=1 Tax=Psychrobacillus psychrotolerans TaxID=126156 RepID=A0A1I5XJQ5_9BACI|nr:DUF2804 domain-containing protein [Psychrobacillus psychrotolerans]SFQ32211.1 Protein of unknown function [Psychrobacillus psychrotolerans]
MKQHAEKEISEPTLLCDKKGNLNPKAIGYAKKPLIESNLKGHYMRKKKWNYWCVFGDDILFSATISHLDYAAVCFVYFLNYETQRYVEKTVTIPLGNKLKMPTNILESIQLHSKEMSIQLMYIQNETHMTVTIPDFDGDLLHADLHISHPIEDDSLNVVIPWNRQQFQFTGKHHTLPTTGFVKIGDSRFTFQPEDNFAVLDYGRGVWPRAAIWNWGFASQRVGSKRIGLNFGGKWTDGTGMTENAIFIDGKMTKIHEDLLFTYDTKDFMKPWKVHTKFSEDVNMTFTPFFHRIAKTDMKFIYSEVNQMMGYFNGRIQLENGPTLEVKQLLGCIEEHQAKW